MLKLEHHGEFAAVRITISCDLRRRPQASPTVISPGPAGMFLALRINSCSRGPLLVIFDPARDAVDDIESESADAALHPPFDDIIQLLRTFGFSQFRSGCFTENW